MYKDVSSENKMSGFWIPVFTGMTRASGNNELDSDGNIFNYNPAMSVSNPEEIK